MYIILKFLNFKFLKRSAKSQMVLVFHKKEIENNTVKKRQGQNEKDEKQKLNIF